MPSPRATCRTVLAIGGAALVGLFSLGSVQPAAAAETATLEVDAGLRGWHDPGDHVLVAAKVHSDELFSGRIDVVAVSGAIVSKDIQVAGGTTKTFMLVVPTAADGSPIDVRLYGGNDLVSKKSVALKIAEAVELVGVLPALVTRVGNLPEQTNLATDAGKAQLAELSLEQMALGSAALDVFDTVVGTVADLRSLQPAPRSALLGWLNRGGRLLLDDSGDLSALPVAWRPGDSGWAAAGRGEVRLVHARASSGQWASIIDPSGTANSEANGFFGPSEQLGIVQQDLARRAGVKLPSMVPLLVPLVAYWATVSVVLFFILRSLRRLTLAWVAIPLLAVLTAGAVVWYGQQWRSAGTPAAATFIDGYPGGGDATASLLTFSRDGGTANVTMPAGWQSDSEVASYFAGRSAGIALMVKPGTDRTQLQVRLEPGQVTTANVLGPTGDIGLIAEAFVQDDKVVGTVTNNSPLTLHDVAVFAPGGAQAIGTLASGASARFALDANALPLGFSLADRVWDGTADSRVGKDRIAEFGIWTNAGLGRVMYPSALVRVAGWTTEMGGIDISGGLTTTTVVTSVAPIQPGSGPLPAASVRWSMVRSPFSQFGNGTADTIYRYVLPTTTALGPRLIIELPVGLKQVDLWNGTGWVKTTSNKRIATVPITSIVGGVVMVRIVNDGQFFPGEQALILRGATTKDPA